VGAVGVTHVAVATSGLLRFRILSLTLAQQIGPYMYSSQICCCNNFFVPNHFSIIPVTKNKLFRNKKSIPHYVMI